MKTDGLSLYGKQLERAKSFIYLGMTFDASGISTIDHVTRLAEQTVNASNMLRPVGFNGYGHAISVKRRMYETFIRPKLEYGLQILDPDLEALKILEKAQYKALCVMFSVSENTSKAALLGITGIQSMRQRMNELNMMWALESNSKGEGFMLNEARKAQTAKKIKRSVFQVQAKNPLWKELENIHNPTMEVIKQIKRRHREKERNTLWAKDSMEGIRRRKGQTARFIDSCTSRRCQRLLTLWLIRKLPGKPEPCRGCNLGGRTTREHLKICNQIDPSSRMYDGQVLRALEELLKVTMCLGRPTSKLNRDLIREHTAWDAREEALREQREQL